MTEQWRGRFLEDFAVGDVYRSRLGRTVTETDNIWFTLLTMNTNQTLPSPVFAGDTLWAESEVLTVRESRSRPSCGIVGIRTRGINQRAKIVIEFTRSFMVFERTAPEVGEVFPTTEAPWTVGEATA